MPATNRSIVLILLCCAAAHAQPSLLVNGGFELNQGEDSLPQGWHAADELNGYEGWIAPRCARINLGVRPVEGDWMVVSDTTRMNVNTHSDDLLSTRAALFQTVRVPAGARGVFSVRYNDQGSTSGAWVSCVRLAYSIDSDDPATVRLDPDQPHLSTPTLHEPSLWGPCNFRTEIGNGGTGDWTRAQIPVEIPPGEGEVDVTFWIGVFVNTHGTERGYWRVDDARFVLTE